MADLTKFVKPSECSWLWRFWRISVKFFRAKSAWRNWQFWRVLVKMDDFSPFSLLHAFLDINGEKMSVTVIFSLHSLTKLYNFQRQAWYFKLLTCFHSSPTNIWTLLLKKFEIHVKITFLLTRPRWASHKFLWLERESQSTTSLRENNLK